MLQDILFNTSSKRYMRFRAEYTLWRPSMDTRIVGTFVYADCSPVIHAELIGYV